MTPTEPESTVDLTPTKLFSRYEDAYGVSAAIVGLGRVIKGLGGAIGLILVILGVAMTASQSPYSTSILPVVVGFVSGILIAVAF